MVNEALEGRVLDHLGAARLAEAASETVRGYGPQILGWMRASLPAADADDAFGIFCESLWKQLPGFRRDSSILTWAYHLAVGAARRVMADPHRRRGQHLASAEMEALAQEVRTTTAIHLRRETSEALARLRAHLDFEEQTLLVLRIDRDLPWTDIATILGEQGRPVAEAALRKRFERLKAKIRDLAVGDGLLPS
jgi:RNA polymerase sigma-70 factor (ECF subfamily)